MLEESHKKLQEMESQRLIRRSTKKDASGAGGAAGLRPRPTLGTAGKPGGEGAAAGRPSLHNRATTGVVQPPPTS